MNKTSSKALRLSATVALIVVGGGLISPARAGWVKSGTANYVSITVPAATISVGPGQSSASMFDAYDATPTGDQSQEFTWTNAVGQNTPFVATVTLTMTTGGNLSASAGPQGWAQADINFRFDQDDRSDQDFWKSGPPRADDQPVPGTVSFTQQFLTTSTTDANGKRTTFVVAKFPPVVVQDQAYVQGAPNGQTVTGTSTATAGPTNMSTKSIDITQ